ncbi:unnamed protein product [Citrullus colocynthis]|uniref:Glutathione synthetase n=1 Tax=Citrullus colocynthis TaxID=252529 RepID=A0ABP0Z775_9ROSI
MGSAHSSCSFTPTSSTKHFCFSQSPIHPSKLRPNQNRIRNSVNFSSHPFRFSSSSSQVLPLRCSKAGEFETQVKSLKTMADIHGIDQEMLEKMVYDALVWSSLHGLVVGDRAVKRSGEVPGVGLSHSPIALMPGLFPETHWKQACELSSIFNELVDRVSMDGKFLQESLSRTKKGDAFTSRLLDIHSKMLQIDKKEEIRLGLHRSDYMLDDKTKLLLQVELNTISCSFPGLSSLVSELHRDLLDQYGKVLGLDYRKIPENHAGNEYAEVLAKAWTEYNDPSAVILFVVQAEERNMYDQHWLSVNLRKRYPLLEGVLRTDGTLLVDGQAIAIVYFRAGYTPRDYPSESEWRARLIMEQSSAVKCPSISYHLVGTKKIQQELAKPNLLERFLDSEEDIAKIRKCFAGLWSLDDEDIVKKAIETPDLFIMKPQREGGGNNIYGDDVRKALLRLQKEGNEEDAAYILMQRIFPSVFPTIFVRDGICHKDHAISELGIFGAYLRNKDKVIVNDNCGYLMRTKVSSSNEGGVAAGFAVLDSIYLT